MEDLKQRWENNPLFQQIRAYVFQQMKFSTTEEARDWYDNIAPKLPHRLLFQDETLDCRGMCISNLEIKDLLFNVVFDYSEARNAHFIETNFQHASARYVDFSGSKFEHVQMSPIFAQGASFRDCVFEGGWLFGHGTFNNNQGDFGDLRECDFTNCKINGANISHADLSQSNLTNARIKDCNFALSVFKGANFKDAQFESCNFSGGDPAVYPDCLVDMRGVNFSGTVFRRCDFSYCQIDDTEQARFVVGRGGNKGIDLIQWMPPIYPLPN